MTGVFVFDRSGDLDVFASAGHAAGWMEAVDVDLGEYAAAYLLDGTVLEIGTAGETVVLRPTDRVDLAGLMARLRAHQRAVGRAEEVGDLVGFANEVLRRSWERRWPRPPRRLERWFPGGAPPRIERP